MVSDVMLTKIKFILLVTNLRIKKERKHKIKNNLMNKKRSNNNVTGKKKKNALKKIYHHFHCQSVVYVILRMNSLSVGEEEKKNILK